MKPKNLDAYSRELDKLFFADPNEATSKMINDKVRITDVILKIYKLKLETAKQAQRSLNNETVEFVNP